MARPKKGNEDRPVIVDCPTCYGTGRIGNHTCGLCHGTGKIKAIA